MQFMVKLPQQRYNQPNGQWAGGHDLHTQMQSKSQYRKGVSKLRNKQIPKNLKLFPNSKLRWHSMGWCHRRNGCSFHLGWTSKEPQKWCLNWDYCIMSWLNQLTDYEWDKCNEPKNSRAIHRWGRSKADKNQNGNNLKPMWIMLMMMGNIRTDWTGLKSSGCSQHMHSPRMFEMASQVSENIENVLLFLDYSDQ